MQDRFEIKDSIKESHIFAARIIVSWIIGFLLICVVIYRMIDLQVVHHEHFSSLSEDNRVRIVPLSPPRGLIYDRNGIVLAENAPTFTLEITPELIPDMEDLLSQLEEILEFSDDELTKFYKLKQKRRYEAIPIKYNLSEEEVARFSVNRHRFPGVEIQARINRHYPLGDVAVHALGYVGRIDDEDEKKVDESTYAATTHIGKLGIERQYESILHGTVGFQQIETDAQGRKLRVLENSTPPIPGQDIYLSIDLRVQLAAEQALKGKRGSVVAIDPNNGEVIALVSIPGFDPNPFVYGIDPESYSALRENIDRPLYNRALQGVYPPGSTFKPFMALAGLQYNVVDPNDKVNCTGKFALPGVKRRFRDWKKKGHGTVDMNKSIVQSCDVYYYALADKLRINRIHDFMQLFGFGELTGIDIIEEKSGLLPSEAWKLRVRKEKWYHGETISVGIGQGALLITPLQLAVATATIASRGTRFQPRMLYAVKHADTGELVIQKSFQNDPVPVAKDSYWDAVISGMHNVVHQPWGTAYRIGRDAEYKIAGKTGTAQVFGLKENEEYEEDKVKERLKDHALFVAFAPVDNPKIAVAVIVENGGHGGSTAAPIARIVMDQYLLRSGQGS